MTILLLPLMISSGWCRPSKLRNMHESRSTSQLEFFAIMGDRLKSHKQVCPQNIDVNAAAMASFHRRIASASEPRLNTFRRMLASLAKVDSALQ